MFRSTSGHLHKAGGLNTVTCEETSCHLHVYLPSNRPASAGERKCASDHSTKICPAKKCQAYGYYLFRILSSSWRLPSCDMLEAQYHPGSTWSRILLTTRDKLSGSDLPFTESHVRTPVRLSSHPHHTPSRPPQVVTVFKDFLSRHYFVPLPSPPAVSSLFLLRNP